MSLQKIWVIEDDASIRWILNKALEKLDTEVFLFETAESAFVMLETETPSVVVTDIRMPGKSGLVFLQEFKQIHPDIPVIVMTAFSDLQTTVDAFKKGAFDYLTKPFDIDDALNVVEKALLHNKQQTPATIPLFTDSDNKIIGDSPAIQKIFTAIGRLSQSDINVLLYGESGTGKELVANALFENSPRNKKPFITINTAAIPMELLESELFGHEKGAFTGATSRRIGRFEQAHNGTLFLDEIGDMPIELQTRLLRVLQDGRFYRVGGHELIQSDVRVIAATNQNLNDLVKLGKFREDLYHRLNVIQIELPALRERREDIRLLANYFIYRNAQSLNIEAKSLSADAIHVLSSFDWAGNVRQLENTCRWLMVMSPAKTIQASDLPDGIDESQGLTQTYDNSKNWQIQLGTNIKQSLFSGDIDLSDQYIKAVEKVLYEEVLAYTNGHKINAAKILGCSRNTITRKIRELDLKS